STPGRVPPKTRNRGSGIRSGGGSSIFAPKPRVSPTPRALQPPTIEVSPMKQDVIVLSVLALTVWEGASAPVAAPMSASVESADHRIRSLLFVPNQVIRLRGWVGYHVDLEFEPDESFVTLGGGDLAGLTYGAYSNHLVLKPKAPAVRTNLTVFTNKRTYVLDYAVS